MLENVYRYIEDGMSATEAAIKGAGEIGFTIVSISFSLVAVFIPLLFMSGLVGRLFREFAVTVTITIMISALVSLTLTPMMCSRMLRGRNEGVGATGVNLAERCFRSVLHVYDLSLQWVLRYRRTTLATLILTIVATGYLYVTIQKGFFPQQDTGFIFGLSEGAQDVRP